MEFPKNVVICWRIQGAPLPCVPSNRRNCYMCNAQVWLSVGTEKAMKRIGDAKAICWECVKNKTDLINDGDFQPPTPEQMNEMFTARREKKWKEN